MSRCTRSASRSSRSSTRPPHSKISGLAPSSSSPAGPACAGPSRAPSTVATSSRSRFQCSSSSALHPEDVDVKGAKSGKSRRVPIADKILPRVRDLAAGRQPDDLLFVASGGHRLHATAIKGAIDWKVTGKGRRIHDLRRTPACLWLARGVDPGTVQAWMGTSRSA
ncbi:tyrosine-type recombinase/integrase [Monashia sp. NPDC004114]